MEICVVLICDDVFLLVFIESRPIKHNSSVIWSIVELSLWKYNKDNKCFSSMFNNFVFYYLTRFHRFHLKNPPKGLMVESLWVHCNFRGEVYSGWSWLPWHNQRAISGFTDCIIGLWVKESRNLDIARGSRCQVRVTSRGGTTLKVISRHHPLLHSQSSQFPVCS